MHNQAIFTLVRDRLVGFLLLVLMQFFSSFISIAIGREGGVGPLIALARSDAEVSIYTFFVIQELFAFIICIMGRAVSFCLIGLLLKQFGPLLTNTMSMQ